MHAEVLPPILYRCVPARLLAHTLFFVTNQHWSLICVIFKKGNARHLLFKELGEHGSFTFLSLAGGSASQA